MDGGRTAVVRADLPRPDAAADAVERTVPELGRIDILVIATVRIQLNLSLISDPESFISFVSTDHHTATFQMLTKVIAWTRALAPCAP